MRGMVQTQTTSTQFGREDSDSRGDRLGWLSLARRPFLGQERACGFFFGGGGAIYITSS